MAEAAPLHPRVAAGQAAAATSFVNWHFFVQSFTGQQLQHFWWLRRPSFQDGSGQDTAEEKANKARIKGARAFASYPVVSTQSVEEQVWFPHQIG